MCHILINVLDACMFCIQQMLTHFVLLTVEYLAEFCSTLLHGVSEMFFFSKLFTFFLQLAALKSSFDHLVCHYSISERFSSLLNPIS